MYLAKNKTLFLFDKKSLICYNVFVMELDEIKGIGAKRKQLFEESGIFSCEDLVNFFPFKYYDFSKTSPYADDGVVKLIKATAVENAKIVKIRGNLTLVMCKMSDEVGHVFNATWFNQTFIKSELFLGVEVYLYGKNSPTKENTFICTLTKFADKFQANGLLPVYHSIGSIGQKVIHDAINFCLETTEIPSFVPKICNQKYSLISLDEAYNNIHNPESYEDAERALERIEIENLIPILAINEHNKLEFREKREQNYTKIDGLLQEFEKLLPFKLTIDQKNACYDIENDMHSNFAMNRMIQGDVGSGKTMVSLFGSFVAIKNGYQAVIIAPTEILAVQHFETAKKIFEKENINVVCLTGSINGLEKLETLKMIENGTANLVVATHAVLSENDINSNLGFATIDEHHRN